MAERSENFQQAFPPYPAWLGIQGERFRLRQCPECGSAAVRIENLPSRARECLELRDCLRFPGPGPAGGRANPNKRRTECRTKAEQNPNKKRPAPDGAWP